MQPTKFACFGPSNITISSLPSPNLLSSLVTPLKCLIRAVATWLPTTHCQTKDSGSQTPQEGWKKQKVQYLHVSC